MKLRHYLKGLGIGMVVTALILHFSVHAAEPSMTDEEVVARARELGMIENVVLSRNDPTISGNGSVSGGSAVSASENAVSASENVTDNDGSIDGKADNDVGSDTGTVGTDTSGGGNNPDVAGNEDMSDGDTAEEDLPPAAGNTEEETEPQEGMAGAEAGQDSVAFTIYNGDSSVSVAGRLAALGLVSSQAEYDAYLCSHGYDRSIRTGVHMIPADATEQQIAEIITSKQ